MRFGIKNTFYLIILCLSAFALKINFSFGLLYLIQSIIIITFSYKKNITSNILFIYGMIIFISYMIRPVILYENKYFFNFDYFGIPAKDDHINSMLLLINYSIIGFLCLRFSIDFIKGKELKIYSNFIFNNRGILYLLMIIHLILLLNKGIIGGFFSYINLIAPFNILPYFILSLYL